MKKKIILIVIFSSFVFVILGGYILKTEGIILKEQSISKKQSLDPKQVVECYFKFYNEKNKKGVQSTMTEVNNGPNKVYEFDNLIYIKLKSIKEDTNPSQKEDYIKYGRGMVNGATEDNIKIYKVEYDLKLKNDEISPDRSGKCMMWITLIRKDKNSGWLIDDMGEG